MVISETFSFIFLVPKLPRPYQKHIENNISKDSVAISDASSDRFVTYHLNENMYTHTKRIKHLNM